MIAWEQVFKLPWKARDAQIEAAIRFVLKDRTGVLSTKELVLALSPIDETYRQQLMGRLGIMAPYLAPLVRHDGEEFVRFGRKMRRWNWYGQKEGTNGKSQ
jgi:hypothetical protein